MSSGSSPNMAKFDTKVFIAACLSCQRYHLNPPGQSINSTGQPINPPGQPINPPGQIIHLSGIMHIKVKHIKGMPSIHLYGR